MNKLEIMKIENYLAEYDFGESPAVETRLVKMYAKNLIYPIFEFDFEEWCKEQRINYDSETIIQNFAADQELRLGNFFLITLEAYFEYVNRYVQNDLDDEDVELMTCEEWFDSEFDNCTEKEG